MIYSILIAMIIVGTLWLIVNIFEIEINYITEPDYSFYSSGGNISIKGEVYSVEVNDELVFGEENVYALKRNELFEETSKFSVIAVNGHYKIYGDVISIKINGKEV